MAIATLSMYVILIVCVCVCVLCVCVCCACVRACVHACVCVCVRLACVQAGLNYEKAKDFFVKCVTVHVGFVRHTVLSLFLCLVLLATNSGHGHPMVTLSGSTPPLQS